MITKPIIPVILNCGDCGTLHDPAVCCHCGDDLHDTDYCCQCGHFHSQGTCPDSTACSDYRCCQP